MTKNKTRKTSCYVYFQHNNNWMNTWWTLCLHSPQTGLTVWYANPLFSVSRWRVPDCGKGHSFLAHDHISWEAIIISVCFDQRHHLTYHTMFVQWTKLIPHIVLFIEKKLCITVYACFRLRTIKWVKNLSNVLSRLTMNLI